MAKKDISKVPIEKILAIIPGWLMITRGTTARYKVMLWHKNDPHKYYEKEKRVVACDYERSEKELRAALEYILAYCIRKKLI